MTDTQSDASELVKRLECRTPPSKFDDSGKPSPDVTAMIETMHEAAATIRRLTADAARRDAIDDAMVARAFDAWMLNDTKHCKTLKASLKSNLWAALKAAIAPARTQEEKA